MEGPKPRPAFETQPPQMPAILHGVRQGQGKLPGGAGQKATAVSVSPKGELLVKTASTPRRRLASGTLTGSAANMFTASNRYVDVLIILSNVDTSARTFTLYHIPSGDSAADANCIGKTRELGVGSIKIYEGLALESGEALHGLCSSANTVSYAIYGTPASV